MTAGAPGNQERWTELKFGAVVFDDTDQIDLTGPYEVLAGLENTSYTTYGLSMAPVRDYRGLRLLPDAVLEEAPQLDVLHVPGGPGQEALMDGPRLLEWLRRQASGAQCVLSVCTGALLLGAAGLLRGRRATTHWASVDLLPIYGATAVDRRVVQDGPFVFAGGVTAGIDAALLVAAQLRGSEEAQAVQLSIQYAPEPPFTAGTPETAPAHVLRSVTDRSRRTFERRLATARRIAADWA
ncbi:MULTISPECIES: DJ-1/PfpI family protein [unclassified Mycolicibacterium]|uniref:DJ-1/PfpI family protein n=1 Tax=unclassified Mycolicibacterium TaxID=2636767 RepID=UPI0012DE4DA0|nr:MULTISPECIES: DJ-1/PfpI family protein [unclassified Mycolicibacterium]MUL82294.1 DJ-1/PfpI family protein [Mycolicibacterium sp. CBMA 329]MUL88060.1 DJ-1/PfpI family protein [Mycolicibacterium sp. CBMA 331]MUM02390.1 DJ-1/PfpI family protein [Mycolicibacterium sp. CBMA 334]MUM24793.1 DJ-1/PfpI family protein [Mycolicibacterium sp. CBMA 295]MUM38357.1 DJ-1/PfpI family protein [Mycolicibacterium sp. CBMA 247]